MEIRKVLTATGSTLLISGLLATPSLADAKYPGNPGSGLSPIVIKTLVIPFNNNVSTLSKVQIRTINSAAKLKNTKFTISGYASNSGDKKYNLRLSKKRAEAIESQILNLQPGANTIAKGFGVLVNEQCSKYENRCVVVTITQQN